MMCDICEWSGIKRECSQCGGYDWVVDVYLEGVELLRFRSRLCSECSTSWADLLSHSV